MVFTFIEEMGFHHETIINYIELDVELFFLTSTQ